MPNNKLYDDQDERLKELENPEWYENTLKDIHNLPETNEPEQSQKKESSPGELAGQEAGVGTDAGQEKTATAGEQNLGQDGSGAGLYQPSEGKKNKSKGLRSKMTKKNGLIATAIVGPVIGIATFITILSPQLIINNLRKMILEDVAKVQTNQSVRYRRSKLNRISDIFTSDGRIGGRIIADMQSRGYVFDYASDGRTVRRITLGDRVISGRAMGEHISDYMEVRHPLRSARWKTKRTNALYQKYGIARASIVARTGKTIDDADTEIRRRINQNSLEGTDVQQDARVPTDADETDEQRIARERQEAIVGEANDETLADIRRAEQLEGIPARESQLGADVAEGLDDVTNGGPKALALAGEVATSGSIGGRVFSSLRGWLNPADIFDRVCTIKNRLRMSSMIARTTRAGAFMRNSKLYVGVADAVRRGTVDSTLYNALMKRLTAIDRNGNPLGASPGIIYAIKGKFNKTNNNAQKAQYAVDGTLPGIFGDIQNATDQVPLTSRSACVILQNPITQVGATVVVTFGRAIACTIGAVFTGGAACAAAEAGIQTARIGVTQAVKTSIQNAIARTITKPVLKQVALSAVRAIGVEVGFEAIMALTQLHIENTTSRPVNDEVGAELGNVVIAGAGVSNKQRSLAAGMVPATDVEYGVVKQQTIADNKEEFKKLSFAERYFGTENTDSLVSKLAGEAMISAPSGTTGAASLPQYAVNFFGDAFSLSPVSRAVNSVSGQQAYAQDDEEVSFDTYELESGPLEGTKLATDFAGNLQVILRSDIEMIDPVENIEFLTSRLGDDGEPYIDDESLEPISEDFTKHIEYCVDTIDILSRLEFEYRDDTDSPQKDCLAKNRITVRMKAHLAYLDMLDGIEAEFMPEEVGASSGETTGATNTGSSAQYIPNCSENDGNAGIACTAIEQLLGVAYSRTQRAAPTVPNPVPFLDCSAFTGMAVYRTFGVDLGGIASVDYRRNPNFQDIPDLHDIKPGDFIGRGTVATGAGGTGHIAIVVSYDRTTQRLVTAETDGSANPSRIVTTKGLAIDGTGYYSWGVRYIGPKTSPGIPQ